jgi:predicted enzyme related to lactoylglutathione lyase
MKKVTGIGGIFFKCDDPDKQKDWYNKHLGIQSESWGTQFFWRKDEKPEEKGYTVWSPFKKETPYFNPSEKSFMINYRVENLFALLDELKKQGIEPVGKPEESDFGKFAWIMDPEGNKIELWEPPVEN